VSKRYLPGKSAATIRNDMFDLEEMGYFRQPHASAGRIPTTRAYRLYVNSVLQRSRPPQPAAEMSGRIRDQRRGIEGALSYATDLLGQLTHCVGVAALSALSRIRLARVDFVRVDSRNVLALVILEGGLVRHRMVTMPCELSQDALDELARRINAIVVGRPFEEVRRFLADRLKEDLVEAESAFRAALDELDRAMVAEDVKLYMGASSCLFDLPDFQDLGRLRALFSILEEGEPLARLVREVGSESGIQTLLGDENPVPEMKDCSLVLASSASKDRRVIVGIVGPLRMDYEGAIAALEGVLAGLDLEGEDVLGSAVKEEIR
jgi:heat-inducible transcriptional repressor